MRSHEEPWSSHGHPLQWLTVDCPLPPPPSRGQVADVDEGVPPVVEMEAIAEAPPTMAKQPSMLQKVASAVGLIKIDSMEART